MDYQLIYYSIEYLNNRLLLSYNASQFLNKTISENEMRDNSYIKQCVI